MLDVPVNYTDKTWVIRPMYCTYFEPLVDIYRQKVRTFDLYIVYILQLLKLNNTDKKGAFQRIHCTDFARLF